LLIASAAAGRNFGPFYASNVLSLLGFGCGVAATHNKKTDNTQLRIMFAQAYFIFNLLLWPCALALAIAFEAKLPSSTTYTGDVRTAALVLTPIFAFIGLGMLRWLCCCSFTNRTLRSAALVHD
jgi:hypothetical protein